MFEKEAAAIGLKVCVNCHTENEWLTGQCVKCGCRDFGTREEILEAQKNGLIVGLLGLMLTGISISLGLSMIYNRFSGLAVGVSSEKFVYGLIFLGGMLALGIALLINAYNFIKYKKGHYFWYVAVFISYLVEIACLLFF